MQFTQLLLQRNRKRTPGETFNADRKGFHVNLTQAFGN